MHLWDRRTGKLPSLSLQAPVGAGDLNSLELSNDEQVRKNSDVHHLALRSYATITGWPGMQTLFSCH